MSTHPNSTAALAQEKDKKRLSRRCRMILSEASKRDSEFSDRQMRQWLGLSDMNAVRPRITELVQDGFLVECGTTIDTTSRKRVRLCRRATAAEIAARRERELALSNRHYQQPDLF